jgi:hypothetical protein
MSGDITRDPIYNTVHRDDFIAMVEVERYADRTDAFDIVESGLEELREINRGRRKISRALRG